MKNTLLLILIAYFIMACSGEKKEPVLIVQKNYKAELLKYFKDNYFTTVSSIMDEVDLDSLRWIQSFYKNNDYSMIWINDSIELTDNAKQLIAQLSNAQKFGLDTRTYSINILREINNDLERIILKEDKVAVASRLDILLSYNYMLFGMHLNYGVLRSIDSVTKLPRKQFKIDLPTYLQEAYKTDSIVDRLMALQPHHIQYRNLQKGLEKFLKGSSLSTENIDIPNFRKDSLEAIKQATKALILHGYLQKGNRESEYLKALAKFQQDHGLKPDMLIGQNTAKALSMSPYEYYQLLVANLEKWKWRKDWSNNYLYVNIPSYQLQLFQGEELIRTHKVVVGKYINQTPEIIDTLEYIIAYPYWHVPKKISVEEILTKAKKDTTYLERNNYEVLTYNREQIDPGSINWSKINESNFNYFIRQKGGPSNALGLVKFIFPNKHAIYLHDTPTKYYFDFETRAYSHGCIRVQKALELAEYLLKEDDNKYNLDSIHYYIKRQKEKPMALNKKLPIYIYYNSVTSDSLGNLTFYDDVYGLDKKLIYQLTIQRDNRIRSIR